MSFEQQTNSIQFVCHCPAKLLVRCGNWFTIVYKVYIILFWFLQSHLNEMTPLEWWMPVNIFLSEDLLMGGNAVEIVFLFLSFKVLLIWPLFSCRLDIFIQNVCVGAFLFAMQMFLIYFLCTQFPPCNKRRIISALLLCIICLIHFCRLSFLFLILAIFSDLTFPHPSLITRH